MIAAINPETVVTFASGEVRLHLPSSHRSFKIDGDGLAVVAALAAGGDDRWQRLRASLRPGTLDAFLSQLASAGVLVDDGREPPRLVEGWAEWGESAWFLHLRSRDEQFDMSSTAKERIRSELAGHEAPPIFKCDCGTDSIGLPRPRVLDQGVTDTLVRRRTCRYFEDRPIEISDLADLLFYTGGALMTHPTELFGPVVRKCAPSPGARHPTELYPVVRRCEGIRSGVHHYCVEHHALTRLDEGEVDDFLTRSLYDQDYFVAASVIVLYTCVIPRLMWKYKTPRVYRLAHFEVGHYAQNFLVTATALGLGAFVTGAVGESVVEARLGLDGVDEISMYASGAGYWQANVGERPGLNVGDHNPDADVRLPPRYEPVWAPEI